MVEHTLIAQLGHLLLIVAFVFALLTATSYYMAASGRESISTPWQNYGRVCFGIHSFSTLAAILLLFFIISQHYFEFHYVWKYSSLDMELKYIFSCFWSGQEGSLLLWSFWIIIISWLGILYKKQEKWIMPFVGGAQIFIISMLLGIYLGDVKIGNSPFILIRELPENAGMPWAQLPDYLTRITAFQDGVGLNPLLQNYWMTIHPPVLFLGFAASLFPFAFAAAGLWQKDFNRFLKPAIPWTVFGVMTLGAGILMGGAWAYEALSFGGFWAWDPVENASLVPWLFMIAALHSLLITNKKKKGYFMSFFIAMAPFLLVLYSSFLTRSGILGESSVHSFTENGLFLHLLLFFLFSLWLAICLSLINKKLKILFSILSAGLFLIYFLGGYAEYILPAGIVLSILFLILAFEKHFPKEEESKFSSREFWLFAGSIIVVLSAIQITVATSIPVINKLYGTSLDALTDLPKRSAFYHTWQIPFAILVTFLMGISHFLKYTFTSGKVFIKHISLPFFISVLATLVLVVLFRFHPIQEFIYILLLFTAIFAIASNAAYFLQILKGKWDFAGSTVAHIGFALLILGALISSSKKIEISRNFSNFDLQSLNESFRNNENILLRQGDTLLMDNYFVTYKNKHKKGVNLHYEIGYYQPVWDKEKEKLKPGDSLFSLFPIVQLNEKFGNVAEPDTYHFLTHDVFTHIKWADMEVSSVRDGLLGDGFMTETLLKLKLGEKYEMENLHIYFDDIFLLDNSTEKENLGLKSNDIAVKAELYIRDTKNESLDSILIEPIYVVKDSSQVISQEFYSQPLDSKFRIAELSNEPNNIVFGLRQREYVVMQALLFPGMNILWAGCFIMVLGCLMVLRQRWKTKKSTGKTSEY